MKAFAVELDNKSFADTIIRSNDEEDARTLVTDLTVGKLYELRPDVAGSMGVPEDRGRHDGALSRWIIGPTTILGDLK